MKKKIAIIGAGLAGLTFANLIKKFSEYEFTLYEKRKVYHSTRATVFNYRLME